MSLTEQILVNVRTQREEINKQITEQTIGLEVLKSRLSEADEVLNALEPRGKDRKGRKGFKPVAAQIVEKPAQTIQEQIRQTMKEHGNPMHRQKIAELIGRKVGAVSTALSNGRDFYPVRVGSGLWGMKDWK